MNTLKHHSEALPFTRSYWARPGQLLGGFYPGDRDDAVTKGKLHALLDCGVTHIINLMQPTEGDHAGRLFIAYRGTFVRLASQRGLEAGYSQHPIRDLGIPTAAEMTATLDEMDSILAQRGCVYVHCWGGRGRTGTAIGCWLARHGENDPLSRLQKLTAHARSHFIQIPETAQQQRFVAQWKEHQ